MTDQQTTEPVYLVVANHEDQHSLWDADLPVPDGWHPEGFSGTREECLGHIEEVWTDLRPLSLRTTD